FAPTTATSPSTARRARRSPTAPWRAPSRPRSSPSRAWSTRDSSSARPNACWSAIRRVASRSAHGKEAHRDGARQLSLRRRGVGDPRAVRVHVPLPLLALPQGARDGVLERGHVQRRRPPLHPGRPPDHALRVVAEPLAGLLRPLWLSRSGRYEAVGGQ